MFLLPSRRLSKIGKGAGKLFRQGDASALVLFPWPFRSAQPPGKETFHHFLQLFHHCLFGGNQHVGASAKLLRRLQSNSADQKRRRNNTRACSTLAKQLFTTFYHFHHCLLRGKKHIGAQLGYYSAACMVIPPTENDGGIMQAIAAPRRNNFSPLFATSHHARWRCCNVTPPHAK